MALLTAAKELLIRAELAEIFTTADAHIFSRPRQIISKQHFIANTTKTVLGVEEVRYLEFYFTGFEDVLDEAQLDEDCVPVRINYAGQIGFQHIEPTRSDASYSHDSVVSFIIATRNNVIDNGDLIIDSVTHQLSRLTEVNALRIEPHPVTEFMTHMWDFSFNVEVRA